MIAASDTLGGRERGASRVTVALASVTACVVAAVLAGAGGAPDTDAMYKLAAVALIVMESLPWLALLWLAAWGYGWVIRRCLVPSCRYPAVTELGLGMAALLWVHWLMGVVIGVGLAVTLVVCGAGLALLAVRLWITRRKGLNRQEDLQEQSSGGWPWTAALCGAPLGLMLVAACCPPGSMWRVEAYGYDTLTYHLQLPKQWLAGGAIAGDHGNVYSYLPNLVEAGYTMIGSLAGAVPASVYACQLFHVTLAIFAAIAVGCIVAGFVGAKAGGAAAAVLLSVPWVMVTASSAYTEMAVLAFGAAALLVVVDVVSERWGGAAAVGVLVGAATLSKLTAGPMIAAPLGLLLLMRMNPALRWRRPPSFTRAAWCLSVAVLAGVLVLLPYLVRNTVWTVNPVFPFATGVLGDGHWTPEQAKRWRDAHGLGGEADALAPAVSTRWLLNTGYGAVGGRQVESDVTDIARFGLEGGFPVLWVVLVILGAAAARRGVTRPAALAMMAVLLMQMAFWALASHRQSRFLIPMLLPASVLIGLGIGRLAERAPKLRILRPAVSASLPLVLVTVGVSVMLEQPRRVPTEDGSMATPPPLFWVDTLDTPDRPGFIGRHPINELPADARVCLVADNGGLLYLRRSVVYATPFDASPLGDAARAAGGDIDETIQTLKEYGITHLWIGWSELDRLQQTHGYDPAVSPELLLAMLEKCVVIDNQRHAVLVQLP